MLARDDALRALASEPFDVLVIGGGITGAGVALDAATNGTAQWTETRNGANTVQVNNGLFSVFLGSVTGIPTSILNTPLWLGVQVGSDPEMTPREQLGAVTNARTADTLGGWSRFTGYFAPHR